MTKAQMIDYLAENLQISHAEAEIAANSALRDSVRRQEAKKYRTIPLNRQLSDANGQQIRNRTMDNFKLKSANL